MAGDPEEQRLRLNAALLSMVQAVEDTTNSAAVAKFGILKAVEMLSQVGLSQASTEVSYPEEEDNCRAKRELSGRGLGLSVVFD